MNLAIVFNYIIFILLDKLKNKEGGAAEPAEQLVFGPVTQEEYRIERLAEAYVENEENEFHLKLLGSFGQRGATLQQFKGSYII